jgi:hypothetical protein
MPDANQKILVLVEGEKTDVNLMKHLFRIYSIDMKYEIIAYGTNIYALYSEMFVRGNPETFDLLQILKAREKNAKKKVIFDYHYSDILLIFDLDPHDTSYTPQKIKYLSEYFTESSDMGKLYINYPMIEAFYHMASIPDPQYDSYYTALSELKTKKYKERVHKENRNKDYRKFAVNKEECNFVIRQNIDKAWKLIETDAVNGALPEQQRVLDSQLSLLQREEKLSVLCTCPFFIPEYNPNLIR